MKVVRPDPRRAAAVSTAAVFMILLFACSLILATGIIPGADAQTDADRISVREDYLRRNTVEGQFFDSSGDPITGEGEPGGAGELLYDESHSDLIGYSSLVYGTSGLRSRFDTLLHTGGSDGKGADVTLTISSGLQEYCYELLDGMEGSLIVMDVRTGKLLACASRSSAELGFNANEIDWNFLGYCDHSAFFLDRATMADDAPGTLFMLLTAACLRENGMGDLVYDDLDGTIAVGDTVIRNFRGAVYGPGQDLQSALDQSMNVYFADAAQKLGAKKLEATWKRFLLGERIELDFTTLDSVFEPAGPADSALLAQTAIGCGRVTVSPLHIAMMMGGILNDGQMMKPCLIERITDDGQVLYSREPEVLSEVLSRDTARWVRESMGRTALTYGFSEEAFGTVYARAGSAEQADGLNHIYFLAGLDTDRGSYVILADRRNTDASSASLKELAEGVIRYLQDM